MFDSHCPKPVVCVDLASGVSACDETQTIHTCSGIGDSPGTCSRSASAQPNSGIQSELD